MRIKKIVYYSFLCFYLISLTSCKLSNSLSVSYVKRDGVKYKYVENQLTAIFCKGNDFPLKYEFYYKPFCVRSEIYLKIAGKWKNTGTIDYYYNSQGQIVKQISYSGFTMFSCSSITISLLIPLSDDPSYRPTLNFENFHGNKELTRKSVDIDIVFRAIENEIIMKEKYKEDYKNALNDYSEIIGNILFIYSFEESIPVEYLNTDEYQNFISELYQSIKP